MIQEATALAKVMAGNVPNFIAKHLIAASVHTKDVASLEESLLKAFDFDANLKIKEMDLSNRAGVYAHRW